jgi:outer membrane protein
MLEAQDARTRAQMPLLRARSDLRTRQDHLTHLLGWKEDHPLAIQGKLAVVPLHLDEQALVQRAIAQRTELRVLEQEIKVKEQELLAVKLTNTPSLSLVGNYEFLQRARNDLPENVLSGGVALSWPIFEGGTIIPRLQAATLALQEVRLRRQQLQDSVEMEVKKAVSDLDVAREAHETQLRGVETAEERVRIAEAGLRAGTVSPADMVRMRMELLDARLSEAQLRFEHAMAKAQLEYLVGAAPGQLGS